MTMKKGSSNFRESSILDIIKFLDELNKEVIIYEPLLDDSIYLGKYTVYEDQDTFFQSCDIVLSNRIEEIPEKYFNKIYTRDIFNTDRWLNL